MVATTDPKHHNGRMELAYTIGFDRTRIIGVHSPSPGRAGMSTDCTFWGLLAMVVVVVVVVEVVVVSPGSVLAGMVVVVVVVVLVVVVLLVVVWPGSVVVVGGVGHDAVATVGIRTAGEESCINVVVVWSVGTIEPGAIVSIGANARDAAGATAGASL